MKNADELETWLMAKRACAQKKWNLSFPIPSSASLVFVDQMRIGGKRIYRYTDGALVKTSDWLLDGEHLDYWLSGFVIPRHVVRGPEVPQPAPDEDPTYAGCPIPDVTLAPIPEEAKKGWPPAEEIAAAMADIKKMEAVVDADTGELVASWSPAAEAPAWSHGTTVLRADAGGSFAQVNLPHEEGFVTPAAEVVVDADTGELIPADLKDLTGFCVSGRKLHRSLEVGRHFAAWIVDRLATTRLVENQDYIVCYPDSGSKECGAESKGRGGHNAKEYRFTMDAAKALSLLQNNAKGDEVRAYFIAAEKRNKPAAPAFQIPTTLAGALRLAADTSEANEQLKLENARLVTDLDVKAEQVVLLEQTVKSVKTSTERTVDLLMARLDVSDKAIPPTEFFKQTASVLGLSSDEGFDYLVAAKIFSQPVKNKWGTNQYKPLAPHDKCGYFQPAYKTNKRSTYDEETGLLTDLVQTERLVTYHITSDRLDKDGNITKLGGFRWLLEKATKSWRTLLNRMIAETGGVDGEFPFASG